MSSSVASLEYPNNSFNNIISFTNIMTSPFTDFFAYHHNDDDHGFQNDYQNNNKDDNNNNNNNSSNNSGNWVPISVSEAAYPVSPSSFLTTPCAFSPSILLGSPLANKFASPTVGAYGGESFNWGGSKEMTHQGAVDGRNNHFSFTAPNIPREGCANSEEPKNQNNMVNKVSKSQFPQNQNLPQEISKTQTDPQPVVQMNRSQKISEDGYCWRKYGQKQVKGSKNPRSYYKCSYPNCPTKKTVERSKQGFITEIVYRGSHNHHKPQSGRISSPSSSSSLSSVVQNCFNSIVVDGSEGSNASSVSVDDDDELEDQSFGMSRSGKDDGSEREAKRWKGENEGEFMSGYGSRIVREPRVIVQTTSEIDMLDDGYRWRKYGQKVVKGNPNPRSYYKCTSGGCTVRKYIERASNDTRAVITTYEGKHNHDVPAARGRSRSSSSSNNSNASLILPVRPAAIVSQPKQITDFNNLSNCTKPDSAHQSHFILQMLQSPESFDFSGFGNPLGTKEVAKDNTFDLESFLP